MIEWQLKGKVLIACNCDWGCPCNFNARPSRGNCEGGWMWKISDGHVRGVRLDGFCIALYADWPGAIHEGGGRAVCYLDERADAAQGAALTSLLLGELGGPWGIFKGTYQLEGPRAARFELELSEYDTRLTIGDAVEIALEKIRNPVSKAEVHPEMHLPEGLVLKHGQLAASKVFRVRDAIQYDHSGQYAAFGPFEYQSTA